MRDVEAALRYWTDDVQIELIQQHDERPSAYRDFLASGREGLQHVSAWVTRAEFEATYARMVAAGVTVAHERALAGGGVHVAYFATDAGAPGGTVIRWRRSFPLVSEPTAWSS